MAIGMGASVGYRAPDYLRFALIFGGIARYLSGRHCFDCREPVKLAVPRTMLRKGRSITSSRSSGLCLPDNTRVLGSSRLGLAALIVETPVRKILSRCWRD